MLIDYIAGSNIKVTALKAVEYFEVGANHLAAILEFQTVATLLRDCGIGAKFVLKEVMGRQYIILQGTTRRRSIYKMASCFPRDSKVVDLALTRESALNSLKSGVRLSIFVAVPINILKYILDDKATMAHLIGETATDLVKIGVASIVAAAVSTAVASIFVFAAGPLLIAAIMVGVGVGVGVAFWLDDQDEKYQITQNLIASLLNASKVASEKTKEIASLPHELEKHLEWQYESGRPVGQGVFY